MSETIRVKVSVDTDELRRWADYHADRGHHGVAHVLYKAASDGESLTEQAIREARSEGAAEVRDDIRARRREFRRLNADSEYLLALDDAFGLAANRARAVKEDR